MNCATCKSALPDGRGRWCNATCRAGYADTSTAVSKPCERCGKTFTASERKLRGVRFERLRFCGNSCAMFERRAAGLLNTTTHGQSRQREYRIWSCMKQRCHNPKASHFEFYGGRGIVVCGEWRDSDGFECFFAHVGPAPSRAHTLDRMDNSRGYEPGNVRWATRKEQSSNMRSNRLVTIGAVTRTVAEWIAELGLNDELVRSRLKHGWSPEDAFLVPKQPKNAPKTRRAKAGARAA